MAADAGHIAPQPAMKPAVATVCKLCDSQLCTSHSYYDDKVKNALKSPRLVQLPYCTYCTRMYSGARNPSLVFTLLPTRVSHPSQLASNTQPHHPHPTDQRAIPVPLPPTRPLPSSPPSPTPCPAFPAYPPVAKGHLTQ